MYNISREAKYDLIKLYSEIEEENDVLAREVYNHYEPVLSLLGEEATKAMERLYPIAFESEEDVPDEEEREQIVSALKSSLND